MDIKCLWTICGVMHMERVKNEEVQKRTGVTGVGTSTRAAFVHVVWTHGENGGERIRKERSRINYEMC